MHKQRARRELLEEHVDTKLLEICTKVLTWSCFSAARAKGDTSDRVRDAACVATSDWLVLRLAEAEHDPEKGDQLWAETLRYALSIMESPNGK